MITGFNTNVRYRGRVFHVQTEDSGRRHPHVISHLYFEGTILASEKRDYADVIDSEDLTSVVRGLMDEQHRAMLASLRRGGFDDVITERLDSAEPSADRFPAAAQPAPSSAAQDERAFGEGIVSQKPLDEVILEYLVEKARNRGSPDTERPARGPRPRE
jgi:hypothetical protein